MAIFKGTLRSERVQGPADSRPGLVQTRGSGWPGTSWQYWVLFFSFTFYYSPGPGMEDTECNQELAYPLLLWIKESLGRAEKGRDTVVRTTKDKKEEVKEGRPHRKLLTQGPLGVFGWIPALEHLGILHWPTRTQSGHKKNVQKPTLTQENIMHTAASSCLEHQVKPGKALPCIPQTRQGCFEAPWIMSSMEVTPTSQVWQRTGS